MSYKSYNNYLGSQRCCNISSVTKGAQGAQGAAGPIGPSGGATGAQGATGAPTIQYSTSFTCDGTNWFQLQTI